MFDSVKFSVSMVTGEEFERFADEDLNYSYSWKYEKPPVDETEDELSVEGKKPFAMRRSMV